MAEYRNSQDIKKAVLRKCGELTSGSSQYDAMALELIQNVYRDLFVGGNEFGIDTAEPWIWAKAERPILLTLKPAYDTGTVSLANASHAGTFSVAPAESMEGRFLKLSGRSEFFRIVQHTASSTSFFIDQPYTDDTTSAIEFKAIQLEYDLVNDVIIITDYNKNLPFRSNNGTFSASLTKGVYTPATFATHVASVMVAADVAGYTGSFNAQTRRFSVVHSTLSFGFLFGSGNNAELSCSKDLGMPQADQSVAVSQTSTYALNGIQRLIGPMTVHRINASEPDQKGKILGIDFTTMLKKHSMMDVSEGIPTHFAEVKQHPNGIMTVRFNMYPQEETRVEVEHIPIAQDLQDNTTSVPLVPVSYRDYLVYAASYFLMCEKKDDQASAYGDLATRKLQSLVNHTRSKSISTGANFGRLVPRS